MFEVTAWDLDVIHRDIKSLLDEINDIKKTIDGFSNRIYELEKNQSTPTKIMVLPEPEPGYQKPFGNLIFEHGRPF